MSEGVEVALNNSGVICLPGVELKTFVAVFALAAFFTEALPEMIMRHGHGTTSDSPKEKQRRRVQGARDNANEEKNRQRSIGGGQPNELGVIQGQSGEQGESVKPRVADSAGKSRH
ncbi:MAG TPA: hypothetical protein VK530_17560 [Candidatus Acidoferrum sp.]|nr:hypothetical protein [Candidatus Acidoferrum sp.]